MFCEALGSQQGEGRKEDSTNRSALTLVYLAYHEKPHNDHINSAKTIFCRYPECPGRPTSQNARLA